MGVRLGHLNGLMMAMCDGSVELVGTPSTLNLSTAEQTARRPDRRRKIVLNIGRVTLEEA